MLPFATSRSQIEHHVKTKSQRRQLTESLQDHFALHPKLYNRHETSKIPIVSRFHDGTETSQTQTVLSEISDSLDDEHHDRKHIQENQSLDQTFHIERTFREGVKTSKGGWDDKTKSPRRVRWEMDMDPSEGTIE